MTPAPDCPYCPGTRLERVGHHWYCPECAWRTTAQDPEAAAQEAMAPDGCPRCGHELASHTRRGGRIITCPRGRESSAAQPTPGPWSVSTFADQINPSVYTAHDNTAVASCSGKYRSKAEKLANARLIAAGPTMADALREIAAEARALARFWEDAAPQSSAKAEGLAQIAETALAKAEGRQP